MTVKGWVELPACGELPRQGHAATLVYHHPGTSPLGTEISHTVLPVMVIDYFRLYALLP